MNTSKLVARATATGMYYDGVAFNAKNPEEALELRPGTTAEDFRLIWGGGVTVGTAVIVRKSLAEKIAAGEISPTTAAKRYVINQQREFRQKSFSVRLHSGKYISRIVHLPRAFREPAYIKLHGTECALVWNQGELALA